MSSQGDGRGMGGIGRNGWSGQRMFRSKRGDTSGDGHSDGHSGGEMQVSIVYKMHNMHNVHNTHSIAFLCYLDDPLFLPILT